MDRTAVIGQIADNMHWLKRETQNHLARTYDAMELSPAQVELLKLISCKGPLSHKELAAEARLTPGAITQLLDGLETANCIVREDSPKDRRVSIISISPTGNEKLQAAISYYRSLLMRAFDALDDDELLAYSHAQQKLIDWHKANCPDTQAKKE